MGTVLAASVACGGSPAAAAGSADILVSADGVTFAPSLDAGLFDSLGPLIPGGSVTASVWIKNATDSAAQLRMSARDVAHSSDAFARALQLSASHSTVGSAPDAENGTRALGSVAECDVLVPSRPIAAGAVAKVSVTFELHDLTGTVGQGDTASLNLLVAMRDAEAGPFAPSACSDTGTLLASTAGEFERLAATGTAGVGRLLLAGGFLVATGAAALALVGRIRGRRPSN